jgi:hypothetical protein
MNGDIGDATSPYLHRYHHYPLVMPGPASFSIDESRHGQRGEVPLLSVHFALHGT